MKRSTRNILIFISVYMVMTFILNKGKVDFTVAAISIGAYSLATWIVSWVKGE